MAASIGQHDRIHDTDDEHTFAAVGQPHPAFGSFLLCFRDNDLMKRQARSIEAFSRKVTTTASHLLDPSSSVHYQNAMTQMQQQLRRPQLQRSVFSMAKTSPTDLVRSKLSTSEIQSRALSYLPDDLLANIPEDQNTYSLFQGFQATLPTPDDASNKHKRKVSRGRKLLEDGDEKEPTSIGKLTHGRDALEHRLEMMGIRKNMASSEIHEIDSKIMNLNRMRGIVLDRLADLEQEESLLEHDCACKRVIRRAL